MKPAAPSRLTVSPNQRFLVDERGEPFFWLGDTAWALFQRLDREDTERYLRDRAARGFSVVMAPAIPPSGYRVMPNGLTTPNRYGELPLVENNPSRPNGAWFDHVAHVIDTAGRAGIYIALLPAWAEYVSLAHQWSDPLCGPVVFDARSAREYGRYLGRRFGDRPNLIWVLGGDRDPPGDEAIWRAMAEGIARGVTGQAPAWNQPHPAWKHVLMTYHATGEYKSSSLAFHNDAWLGTNMIQTWAFEEEIIPRVRHDYALTPPKPTLVGEPSYEGLLVPENPNTSTPWRVRYQAYWALFTGAHGHVYGHHDIWRFPEKWTAALAADGADDMRHVRALMESRPMLSRVPDQGMIASSPGSARDAVVCTRDADGAYAMVYLTSGGRVDVDMSCVCGGAARGFWYDPREGSATEIGTFSTGGVRQFEAPSSGAEQDWVLVLDEATRDFVPPGAAE